ncbi:MAG TPA: right-handed parallel beta-helix repeat-containing protein [Methylomirabilota bacterium]|jgi:hypothetical protein|nr:right-handed parallel beta-helix repeat-containing protein [Methylomirabilota bacterium]
MRFLAALLPTLVLAGAAVADAAPLRTFYVATTGNDGFDGSLGAPWRTMQHAANVVRAGDQVIVRAGHYAGFNLETSGTAADPILFSADPGVIVDTPNPVRTQDGINLEGASWIVVEGFTVLGMPRTGIRSVTNAHVTIRRNVGDSNGRWGILTGFSDDLLIEDNEMSRSVAEHGIYVGNSGDRPIIRRNHVWGNSGNGIHMNGDLSQGGDGIISGAVVEANVIHGNGRTGGSGINGDGVQSSRIVNNILYDNHASGISLYQIDGGAPSRNNVVAHNTIIQAADGRWAINIKDGSTGNHVVNNILLTLHTFRGSISVTADSLAGFVSDGNAVTARFTTDDGDSILTLAAWRTATGQDAHSFASTSAALFVDAASGDYHLSATSPARDAGIVTDVTTDFDGAPRPVGPAADIGADEFASAPPPPPPPPPADLVVSALSKPPASVRRGGHFTVTDSVRNQGGTAAGPSSTRYYLSSDSVKSASDRALDNRRSVMGLAPGATSTGSVSVMVPTGLPRGTYFLIACADAAAAVTESTESNNCRTAAASVSVK